MSKRQIEYEVSVSKRYHQLSYDQLVETLKEVENCCYGTYVNIERNNNEYGEFKGTYDVIVTSYIGGISDPSNIQAWCDRQLEDIKEFTE